MRELVQMGPVDYLLVEFPTGRMTGEGFPLLVDLVERGIIQVLDLVFVRKREDGTVEELAVTDLHPVFEGAGSGLVDPIDIIEAGEVLTPGSTAAVLVYENLWAAPLASALRRGGGQLVASGRIPVQALLAEVERLDAQAVR